MSHTVVLRRYPPREPTVLPDGRRRMVRPPHVDSIYILGADVRVGKPLIIRDDGTYMLRGIAKQNGNVESLYEEVT